MTTTLDARRVHNARLGAVLLVLGASIVVTTVPAQADLAPSQACAKAKLKLAATALLSRARCSERAANSGSGSVSIPCVIAASSHLDERWTRIEEKGGCSPSGPSADVRTFVEGVAATLDSLLHLAPASRCTARKLRAAARKGACLLRDLARDVGSGTPTAMDATCGARLAETFATVEARGGCNTTGDETSVEQTIDFFAIGVESAIVGTPVCCAAQNGFCTLTSTGGGIFTCIELELAPGSVGTVCDGATGACVTAPASPGPCCGVLSGTCAGGPVVDASGCASLPGGVFSAAAVCRSDGTCSP